MNLRTLGILAAMLALVAIIGLAATGFDPFGARKRAEAHAVTAEQQSAVDTTTAAVTADTAAKTIVIHRITQGATEYVQAQPGADDALPPAVASAVRDGVERLRQPAEAGRDQPAADVPGAVR